MSFARVRIAGVSAVFAGLAVGVLIGWLRPSAFDPVGAPDRADAVIVVGTYLVALPLLGVAEMLLIWERSRLRQDLRRLRTKPQAGMGLVSPGVVGLAVGLPIGWAL